MPKAPKLKALLVDLNGTLHVGSTPTPRAAAAVEKLRAASIPFVFCSNNTKESEKRLHAKLEDMGLAARPRELMTSLGACRALVERRGLSPYLLLSPEAQEEFAGVPTPPAAQCDAVVLGLYPPAFAYDGLNTAFRILKGEALRDGEGDGEEGAGGASGTKGDDNSPAAPPASPGKRAPVLIAPHRAAYFQAGDTPTFPAGLSLGIGAYVRALEDAAGVTAKVVGKPTRAFFELAIARLREQGWDGADSDVGIVGDDITNDLGAGAQELGLTRVLVRTGKYRPGAEESAVPDATFDTFADFVDALVDA